MEQDYNFRASQNKALHIQQWRYKLLQEDTQLNSQNSTN